MKCLVRAGLLSATLFVGCADDWEPIPGLPDGGAPVDAVITESGASTDVSVDAPIADRYIDWFDVIPLPDAGCPACIRDRCGSQLNACFNNPACAAGVFCTLQLCATGLVGGDGGLSPTNLVCVLGCFNGDQATAFMALGSLTCLTMTCGGACTFGNSGRVDAGPTSDVPTQPDALEDVSSKDGNADATAPDAGPATDADEPTDGDSASPGDDAAPETGSPGDSGSPIDATLEMAPPDEGGSAD